MTPDPNMQASAAVPKKGLSPLAWVGIGCGGLVMLAIFGFFVITAFVVHKAKQLASNPAMATAKLIAAGNPDMDVVDTDEATGKITVRNKKTGEVVTMNLGDAKKGRLEITGKDGQVVMDGNQNGFTVTSSQDNAKVTYGQQKVEMPSWLPAYPGGTFHGTFDTTSDKGRSAAFTLGTSDPPAQVIAFYQAKLQPAGFQVTVTTLPTGQILAAQGGKRTLSVTASQQGSGTQAMVSFTETR